MNSSPQRTPNSEPFQDPEAEASAYEGSAQSPESEGPPSTTQQRTSAVDAALARQEAVRTTRRRFKRQAEVEENLRIRVRNNRNVLSSIARTVMVVAALVFIVWMYVGVRELRELLLQSQTHVGQAVAQGPIEAARALSYLNGGVVQGMAAHCTTLLQNVPSTPQSVVTEITAGYLGGSISTTELRLWIIAEADRVVTNRVVSVPSVALGSTLIALAENSHGLVAVTSLESSPSQVHIRGTGRTAVVSQNLPNAAVGTEKTFAFVRHDGALVGYNCGTPGNGTCCIATVGWDGVVVGMIAVRNHCPRYAVEHRGFYLLVSQEVVAIFVDDTTHTPGFHSSTVLPFASSIGTVGAVVELPVSSNTPQVIVAVAIGHEIQLFSVAMTVQSGETAFIHRGRVVSLPFEHANDHATVHGVVYRRFTQHLVVLASNGRKLLHMALVDVISWGEASPLNAMTSESTIAQSVSLVSYSASLRATIALIHDYSSTSATLKSFSWDGGMKFAGLAIASASLGDQVSFVTKGISTGHRNLKAGTPYGVAMNGTLLPMTDGAGELQYAGLARSADTLDVLYGR